MSVVTSLVTRLLLRVLGVSLPLLLLLQGAILVRYNGDEERGDKGQETERPGERELERERVRERERKMKDGR